MQLLCPNIALKSNERLFKSKKHFSLYFSFPHKSNFLTLLMKKHTKISQLKKEQGHYVYIISNGDKWEANYEKIRKKLFNKLKN